jgi:aspartate racemase
MKTLGIIGGIGPESTLEYYRFIIDSYREKKSDGSYPCVIINSINLQEVLKLLNTGRFAELAEHFIREIRKLAGAGADFGLLAANTAHIVFDEVERQSPIPLISIVQATCDKARSLGLNKVGLFGTRFTMQGRFYPEVFSTAGVTLAVPNQEEQAYIHDKYMSELINGILLPETRERLLSIVEALQKREAIEGLILGGTELPLILRDAASGIPFLDTTKIHVESAVARLLS